ncbi:MAG: 2'-5' RNA ligase [Parcubacteria group bacterium GW2011_GWC1_43_11]|uniref:RNA 2',3'-cyclic phosphodiesterase n=1 Tax=Candidatus Woesebacteria bacterium GW2011_GWA1_41_13b TaxID=1618555 RepID=A0A0G0UTR3_9BACT|nr:MAG: 2'-5' RNA ligase [Candidatus Woesebacteria bacterium GW2011_GWA1_41_13b]KKS87911.1 MAG: 2'-5' RNA ligase [Parcubacteria group bacterium GW2011_GWC1_43_11]
MKHRLFTAITLPEAVSLEIARLQKDLDRLKLPVVWDNTFHLTLNFLGQVTDSDTGTIKNLISDTTKNFYSFTLQLLYLDTLYSRHDPTILYLTLAKSDDLIQLQASLSSSFSSITPQPRKFLPHITIGKFKRTDPVTTKHFIDLVSDFATPEFSEIPVDKIILYESLPSKVGTTYRQISQFMLQSQTI